jgi:acetylglutamate kinase
VKLLIKIGGTLVDDPSRRAALAGQIAGVHRAGHAVVVVHGGGKQLTRFLEARGVESRFVNGLRVTGEAAMDAVVKVLAGTVNKELTGALRASGVNAVGVSGMDGRLTTAIRMSEELGRVGKITAVDPLLLDVLTGAGMTPVVACVAGDDAGLAWNVNADQMAVGCAKAFGAHRLIFLTDVAGVMDGEGKAVPVLTLEGASTLIARGVARGGMQAKLEAAGDALKGGVGSVVIAPGVDADVLHRLLTGLPCGTELRMQ